MKRITYLVVLLAVFLASQQGQIAESLEENYDSSDVHQQNWSFYAQEPLIDLKMAREAFTNEDFESAAYSLRQVNAYLILESTRLESGHQRLSPIINDINKLTGQLERESIVSSEEYNRILTEVNYTLSNHYHEQAKSAWENNNPVKAGRALEASTKYLERAERISNNNFTEDDKSVVEESKNLSNKLINGDGNLQNEAVKPKLKAFGGLLKDFKNKSSDELRMERSF